MIFHTRYRPQQVHPSVFIATGAVVVGDVLLDQDASVWFNAVLRGDTETLHIGAGTNIQDGAILHADPGYPTIIGTGCTVGHRAIVHGAQVGDNTLVGMGAILLNGVEVGANCIIGAGALLTQHKTFPAGSMILGSPAKVVRELTDDEIRANQSSAASYVLKAKAFKEEQHSSC
ncbi:MAG: gamma carbonic anhydrase family protein [Anaerolineaceae bacterium]|nr:gamma carbonic anhydrase family protein [Anaerolineaceae bacterium]